MNFITKALAAGDYNINIPVGAAAPVATLNGLVDRLVNLVGIIAGVILFFYLVFSGFQYLTAGGNADQAKKGQQGIVNAIIGIILIVASYSLFQIINGVAGTVSHS